MKLFNYWHLILVLLLSLGSYSCAQNKATIDIKEDEQLVEFTTDRFTLPNLHVTPDGKSIIFDVLGDIYQVPIEGGVAEVLLQDDNWKRGAKLSPDGKTLAYISDETGGFLVWTMNLETKEKRVYPIKEYIHSPLYAYWETNNELLIPSKNGLQSFNVLTGKREVIRPALEEEKSILHTVNRNMNVSKSGTSAFYQKDGVLWCYDINKQIDLFVGEIPDNSYMEFFKASPSGKKVLLYKKNKDDNSKQDLMYLDLITNDFKTLNTTDNLGTSTKLNYSFDFIDEETIILNKEGEIVSMHVETGEYEPIPIEVDINKIIKKPLSREPQCLKDSIITASVLRNPVIRPGMDTIYFGAFGKLHSYDKSLEQITEIYPEENRFEVSPSLSPNGKYLAYTTWNDTEMGHVYAREIKTGKEYQLTKTPGRYINPAWSPAGTEIVFIADETEAKMGIPRQSGGTNTHNYHLDIHRIKPFKKNMLRQYAVSDTIHRVYPFSIVPRRYYPIPVYHPKSESVYITTRSHEKDLPVLIQIDLDTKEILQEKLIPYHTDEVLISPDANHIAFIFDEQIWLDTFPHSLKLKFSENSEFISKQYHYKNGYLNNILLPEAKSIYEIAPSYLSWQDGHTLMWGSGEEIYTYDLRTDKVEKLADINVQEPRAMPKTKYALTNAKIITINNQDRVLENGTVLVKNNRIEAVGDVKEISIPEDYKVFNLKGKTIIPGLIDVHAHYHHAPYEFQMQQNYKYVGNLAYGITSFYDPSVNVLDYRERAQMVEIGKLLGPRVFASGNIILDFEMDYDYRKINSLFDTERIVKSNKKLGVNGLLKQYNRKNRLHRKWLYKSARKYKLTLTNHETNFLLAMTQIMDGYTAMEHEKYTFPIQKDIISFIGQSGVHYTPTFMVSPRIGGVYMHETIKEKPKLKKLNGQVLFKNRMQHRFDKAHLNTPEKNQSLNREERELKRASITLKNIVDVGGEVSVGGHGNPLPGIGTHWELWSFTYDNGLSNYQALQAATINGAEKLDLQEEIGSIEEGKLADMVILNNDPLESIFNTTDILYTIQNGNIYEADTMKQIHPIEKELKPWGWVSPKALKSMEKINRR